MGARITGSRTAGIASAVLWTTSFAVAVPLMWSAAYNQILCSFLILAALYARARWIESGETRWRVAEWVAYLAGFGAHEVTVMYPIAAVLYTWLVAKRKDRAVWTLFLPAIIFGAVHLFVIPRPPSEAYQIAIDGRLPMTAWTYLLDALGPGGYPGRWIVGVGLFAVIICRMLRRDWPGLFPVLWFFIFLLPVLVLPNHILTYYLTVPLIGLAWAGGWAIDLAMQSRQLPANPGNRPCGGLPGGLFTGDQRGTLGLAAPHVPDAPGFSYRSTSGGRTSWFSNEF